MILKTYKFYTDKKLNTLCLIVISIGHCKITNNSL